MHEKFKHIATRRRNERGLFEWNEYLARRAERSNGYSFARERGRYNHNKPPQTKTKETNDGNAIL